MMVEVLAATGQLGSRVVRSLLDRGACPSEVVAAARAPERARHFEDLGVAVRRADYDRPDTLAAAFRGIEVLMLIPSMAGVEPRIAQHAAILDAARTAGVRRIVLTSFSAARPVSKFEMAPYLLYAESKLRLSGLEWTILRNGMYLDPVADWAPALAELGRLPYPVARGRVAYISRDDIARATAAACLNPACAGRVYELTGAAAVSMPELAAALSAATGRPVRFDRVTEDGFSAACRADEVPEALIRILVTMYRAVENGEFECVSRDVEVLTGEPPQPVADYLRSALQSHGPPQRPG